MYRNTAECHGTQLSIEAKTANADYTLVASGSKVVDGKFYVVDNINAKYVQNTQLAILSKAASEFVAKCQGNIYMQTGEANASDIGSVALTSTTSSGGNKTTVLGFTYYDTVVLAKAAYDAGVTEVNKKTSANAFDASSIVGTTEDNGMTIRFTSNVTTDTTKVYAGYSTIYMTAYYKNVVWEYKTYFSHYVLDDSFRSKDPDAAKAYYQAEVAKLATAMEEAMKAAYTA